MKADKLPHLPIDMADYFALTSHLTPKQLGCWLKLRCHIWQHGALPAAPRDLAAVAGVHPRSWEIMAPVLDPLFDHDETGGWHDFELEDERAANVAQRARRAVSGAKGAQARWSPRIVGDDNLAPSPIPDVMAGAIASAMDDTGLAVVDATGKPGLSDGSGLASHGPTDGLESLSSEEDRDNADGRTDGRASAAAMADAMAEANGEPPSDADIDGSPRVAAAMADANGQPPRDAAMNPAAGLPPAMATRMADAMPQAAERPPDDVIIGELRRVGGGKIPHSLLTSSGIAPIRTLMDQGCDFRRDILPAIEATVPGLSAPLRSLKALFLREAACANRDRHRAGAQARAAHEALVFVMFETPQWHAWVTYRRRAGKGPVTPTQRGLQRGWYFETEWPPSYDPPGEPARRRGSG